MRQILFGAIDNLSGKSLFIFYAYAEESRGLIARPKKRSSNEKYIDAASCHHHFDKCEFRKNCKNKSIGGSSSRNARNRLTAVPQNFLKARHDYISRTI